MITNFTLASVASTVYQAQAAQAAAEAIRAQRSNAASQQNIRLEADQQRRQVESEKLLRARGASPTSFSDVIGQSLAMSSVAFLKTFGGDTAAFDSDAQTPDQQNSSRQRGYTAYQQYTDILDALRQIQEAAGEDSTASAADFASLLPKQLARNTEIPSQDAPFAPPPDFSAATSDELDAEAPPYFRISYNAFSRAMDFRNQAFSFPPKLNLLG